MPQPPVVVLGLPRGGVPVAAEVAARLHAPLDVCVVRKLGHPLEPELAIGAIAQGGVLVREDLFNAGWQIDEQEFQRTLSLERAELDRRERRYRGDRPLPSLAGATVILVDDGIATGATMLAAVRSARQAGAARVIAAAPVAAAESVDRLGRYADEVVVLQTPSPFMAIGQWYRQFDQLSDQQVLSSLEQAHARPRAPRVPA